MSRTCWARRRVGTSFPGFQQPGFTLIEVLVSLGIVAVALAAGSQATGALLRNAQRQSDAMLAQACAENALVRIRLVRQMPGIGDTESECEQAGRSYRVRLVVRPTPNPNFQRVDARVFREGAPIMVLSTVIGRN